MAQFKIDKCVPVPPPNPGRKHIYPLAEMQPGDSFFVRPEDAPTRGGQPPSPALLQNRLLASCNNYIRRKNPGAEYAVRILEGGVRVWRMK